MYIFVKILGMLWLYQIYQKYNFQLQNNLKLTNLIKVLIFISTTTIIKLFTIEDQFYRLLFLISPKNNGIQVSGARHQIFHNHFFVAKHFEIEN